MSSNRGVFRIARTELAAFDAKRSDKLHCIFYGVHDGLKSKECNGGFQPAGWKTSDGRLWFPTMKGVAVADPKRIRQNRVPPPIVIDDIEANGRRYEPNGVIAVPPGSGKLEVHFVALSFEAPEKVKYRYILEGFDRDWTEAGGRREAYYTNLPPGPYRFRVTACNNDGVWNMQPAEFEVRLEPRFYQTWWFLAALLGVVASACWAGYGLRVQHAEAAGAAPPEAG